MLTKPFLERLLEIVLNTFLFRVKKNPTLRNFWRKHIHLLFFRLFTKVQYNSENISGQNYKCSLWEGDSFTF